MFRISSATVQNYFNAVQSFLGSYMGNPILNPISLIIALIVFAIALMIIVSVFGYLMGWFERKFMARMQSRRGPTYVGKFGILLNLADLIKLLSKENIVPANADKRLFQLSIPMMLFAFVMVLAFIPLTHAFVGVDTSIGLIVVFMILSFLPLLIFLAGWTSFKCSKSK